jgi:fibronectin-binding autotransporter adhesin
MTFAGRGSQTITSAGRTFTQPFTISTPGGSVTLQDAFTASFSGATVISLTSGTFNAATYNVTLSGTGAGTAFNSSGSTTRTIAVGSGTWSFSGAGTVWNCASTGLTVTGTGTISLTSASAKTFAGGGVNYSGITLNQGGAGALTITGNNTFKTITNTYSATGATSIALGATTQTLTQPWTATGEAGRVLTISGTSAASPATLIFSGAGTAANVDYLAIFNVRAYNLTDTWYAGANSTNGGSLGWIYASGVIATAYLGNFFAFF